MEAEVGKIQLEARAIVKDGFISLNRLRHAVANSYDTITVLLSRS